MAPVALVCTTIFSYLPPSSSSSSSSSCVCVMCDVCDMCDERYVTPSTNSLVFQIGVRC